MLTAAGVRIIKTPVEAPWAERHLRLVLGEYADHYNSHRPHRALRQEPLPGDRINRIRE